MKFLKSTICLILFLSSLTTSASLAATSDTNTCFDINSLRGPAFNEAKDIDGDEKYTREEIEGLIPTDSTCLVITGDPETKQTFKFELGLKAASEYVIPFYIQGNIQLNSEMSIFSNTTIIGIDRVVGGETRKSSVSSADREFSKIFNIRETASNIIFQDLKIKEARTINSALINLEGKNTDVTINNVDFQGKENNSDQITKGIYLQGDWAESIIVNNSRFDKLEYSIHLFAPVSGFSVTNSSFTLWNHYAILNNRGAVDQNRRTQNVLIENNDFIKAAFGGTRSVINFTSGNSYYYIKNIDILNNRVIGNGGFFTKPAILEKIGYSQADAERIAFESDAHGDQIVLHRVNGFNISNNLVTEGGENGITAARLSRNGVISGNTVSRHDGNGINIGGGQFDIIVDDVSQFEIGTRILGTTSRNLATVERVYPENNALALTLVNNNNKRINPDPITSTTFQTEVLEIIPPEVGGVQPPNIPNVATIQVVDRTKRIRVEDNEVFDNGLNQFPEKAIGSLIGINVQNSDSIELRRNNLYNTLSLENQAFGITPSRSRQIHIDDSNCFQGVTMNPHLMPQARMGLLSSFASSVPLESDIVPSTCPLPTSNPQRCVSVNFLDQPTITGFYEERRTLLEAKRDAGGTVTNEDRQLTSTQINSLVPSDATCISLKGEPNKSDQSLLLRFGVAAAGYHNIPLEIEGVIHNSGVIPIYNNTQIKGVDDTASIKSIDNPDPVMAGVLRDYMFIVEDVVKNVSLKNFKVIEDYPINTALILMQGDNRDITFDGIDFVGKDPHASRNTRGIYLDSNEPATNVTIKNSSFTDLEYGVHMTAAVNGFRVAHSNFTQWAHYAILLNRSGTNLDQTSRNIDITDNTMQYAIAGGKRGTVMVNPGNALAYIKDVNILRNTFTGNGGSYIKEADDPDFANNNAHGDQLLLHRVDGFTIAANTFTLSGENSISVTRLSRNGTIHNNDISLTDGQGIAIGTSYFFMTVSDPTLLNRGDRIRGLSSGNIATVTRVIPEKNLISVGLINGKRDDISAVTFANEDIVIVRDEGLDSESTTPAGNVSNIQRTKNIAITNNKLKDNGVNSAGDKDANGVGAIFVINADNLEFSNNKFTNSPGLSHQAFAIDASRSRDLNINRNNTVEGASFDIDDRSHLKLKLYSNLVE